MPLPQPEDLADRIRALEQAVRDLKSSITNQSPLVSASAGWIIPNQAFPPAPPSGGHLTASGNEPIWTEAGGATYSLVPSPPFTGTITPQYPTSFSSPATIVSAPTAQNYNDLRADAAMLQVCLRDVINKGATTTPRLWPTP
ncbi:hypothetical protein AB0J35_57735 [Nonomuraea angiospora]|uniref:hypothetical protein n=1 Tax=Nonomuraea angiospora TaxID=46172 RepID=UPI003440AD60